MYSIPIDLEKIGQYGALLHMLFPRIIIEICIAQNGAGSINCPVISSHAPRVVENLHISQLNVSNYFLQSSGGNQELP